MRPLRGLQETRVATREESSASLGTWEVGGDGHRSLQLSLITPPTLWVSTYPLGFPLVGCELQFLSPLSLVPW